MPCSVHDANDDEARAFDPVIDKVFANTPAPHFGKQFVAPRSDARRFSKLGKQRMESIGLPISCIRIEFRHIVVCVVNIPGGSPGYNEG